MQLINFINEKKCIPKKKSIAPIVYFDTELPWLHYVSILQSDRQYFTTALYGD